MIVPQQDEKNSANREEKNLFGGLFLEIGVCVQRKAMKGDSGMERR
jgi:hypothetical protein